MKFFRLFYPNVYVVMCMGILVVLLTILISISSLLHEQRRLTQALCQAQLELLFQRNPHLKNSQFKKGGIDTPCKQLRLLQP